MAIIPTLNYAHSSDALRFLCDAFGFGEHTVHRNDDGSIAHATLTYGDDAMVMISQTRDSEFGKLQRPPVEGQPVTQSPYIVVADADAHYAQAKAVGATIVYEIRDEDYGGRGYSCVDLEGHLWNFGTYDPWAA